VGRRTGWGSTLLLHDQDVHRLDELPAQQPGPRLDELGIRLDPCGSGLKINHSSRDRTELRRQMLLGSGTSEISPISMFANSGTTLDEDGYVRRRVGTSVTRSEGRRTRSMVEPLTYA
jgi:hypothetical protein